MQYPRCLMLPDRDGSRINRKEKGTAKKEEKKTSIISKCAIQSCSLLFRKHDCPHEALIFVRAFPNESHMWMYRDVYVSCTSFLFITPTSPRNKSNASCGSDVHCSQDHRLQSTMTGKYLTRTASALVMQQGGKDCINSRSSSAVAG